MIDCNYKTATVIVERSSPSFELNILTEDFSDSNTVEINIVDQGIGTYEFSLDHNLSDIFILANLKCLINRPLLYVMRYHIF